MIGRLTGLLIEKKPPQLLIDVSGVAYEVAASMNSVYQLPEEGQQVTLHTHLVVREDAQLLFGFYDKQERTLFRHLIQVNGIGPKLALTILSNINTEQFVLFINTQDTRNLVKLPGIGKKTAERLVIEMRDRLHDWEPTQLATADQDKTSGVHALMNQITQDALNALLALGYKAQEARRAITAVYREGLSRETLIREALQSMAS